jgi:hypothetical protein
MWLSFFILGSFACKPSLGNSILSSSIKEINYPDPAVCVPIAMGIRVGPQIEPVYTTATVYASNIFIQMNNLTCAYCFKEPRATSLRSSVGVSICTTTRIVNNARACLGLHSSGVACENSISLQTRQDKKQRLRYYWWGKCKRQALEGKSSRRFPEAVAEFRSASRRCASWPIRSETRGHTKRTSHASLN